MYPGKSDWMLTMSFIIVGIASLLPWNAFITASEYFRARFCGTDYERTFESFFSISFMGFQILGLLTQLFLEYTVGYQHRLLIPLLISFCLFLPFMLSVYLNVSAILYFGLSVILASTFGFVSLFLIGGLFEFAASRGASKFSQAAMTGQALSGVIISGYSYVSFVFQPTANLSSETDLKDCKLSGLEELKLPTLLFFLFPTGMLVLSLVLCFFHIDSGGFTFSKSSFGRKVSPIVNEKINYGGIEARDDFELGNGDGPSVATLKTVHRIDLPWNAVFLLLYKLINFVIPLVSIYTVTLSIFPSLTSRVALCGGIHSPSFIGFLFLMYNIIDALGRYVTGYTLEFRSWTMRVIYGICISRLFLAPLMLLLCFNHRILFCSNVTPVLIVSLLGLSNGYAASLCMMHWSRFVEATERDMGATLMILSITTGLSVGSVASFAVVDASVKL